MPNTNQIKKTIRVVFDSQATDADGVSNSTIATHKLGVFLPANAVIVDSAYDVITTFTSATDAATISFGIGSATDLKAATAISTGTTYDNVTNMVAGTPVSAATAVKLSADGEFNAVVAVEALTAGKLVWYVDYVLNVG